MTLDEAIMHCEDRAKEDCSECAEEHRQLAEWLKELKSKRKNLNFRKNQRKDDSMGKTIVVCRNDDCVYRGDNGECGKDIIYLDDLGTCEDSE